jgi:hypothetical protein
VEQLKKSKCIIEEVLKHKWADKTLKGIKINLSRKQIPLCKTCYVNVYAGKYDGSGRY